MTSRGFYSFGKHVMSRSYKKIFKQGFATGSNTGWQKYTRQQCREHDRQEMNNIRKYYHGINMYRLVDDDEYIDNFALKKISPYCDDKWNEPTDGHTKFYSEEEYVEHVKSIYNIDWSDKMEKEVRESYRKILRK